MSIDEILEQAASTAPPSEPFTFRLPVESKEKLLAICQHRHLSAGRLVRALVEDFIVQCEKE